MRWAGGFRPEHTAEIEALQRTGVRIVVTLRAKHEIVGAFCLALLRDVTALWRRRRSCWAVRRRFALLIENPRLNERALEQECGGISRWRLKCSDGCCRRTLRAAEWLRSRLSRCRRGRGRGLLRLSRFAGWADRRRKWLMSRVGHCRGAPDVRRAGSTNNTRPSFTLSSTRAPAGCATSTRDTIHPISCAA